MRGTGVRGEAEGTAAVGKGRGQPLHVHVLFLLVLLSLQDVPVINQPAFLLQHVGQLVGQQVIPVGCAGPVLAPPEENIGAKGECLRPDAAGDLVILAGIVNPDRRQVRAKGGFEPVQAALRKARATPPGATNGRGQVPPDTPATGAGGRGAPVPEEKGHPGTALRNPCRFSRGRCGRCPW